MNTYRHLYKTLRQLTLSIVLIALTTSLCSGNKPPQLTIVIIVDQLAYHYFPKLSPHFKHGYRFLLDNGVTYENAYHPSAIPETSTGHNTLSTGTTAQDHGIITNSWFNQNNKEIFCDEENNKKTSIHTMVDGFSDRFMLNGSNPRQNKVFSLSIKSRASIGTAHRMGKAIWFDRTTGQFTSCQKYFSELPAWLESFNKKSGLTDLTHVTWKKAYPGNSPAYDFDHINNYDYAGYDFSFLQRKTIPIDHAKKDPYELFVKTPAADSLLFDLAKSCIKHNFKPDEDGNMLLWLSLSSLDLIGHIYGPDSMEAIDFLYHQDKLLKQFISYIKKDVGLENTLLVLTADHGIQPIQEIQQLKGFSSARRIIAKPLITTMNDLVQKKYGITNLVDAFESSAFYLNYEKFSSLSSMKQHAILRELTTYLESIEGIKHAWSQNDLKKANFEPGSLESFYKKQLYPERSGHIICMPQPYCLITDYPTGASHNTPYDYDTHVPLILYRKNHIEDKTIKEKVLIPQLAPTLGHLLGVPAPSSSTYRLLPGLTQRVIPKENRYVK